MPENTIQSDIFKFVALRPPVSVEKKNQEIHFISDNREPEGTPVGKFVKTLDSKDGTKNSEQIKRFIASNHYDLNYPESSGDLTLSKIYQYSSSLKKDEFDPRKLVENMEHILNTTIQKFLNDNETQALFNNVWDRYYAFYILARTENQNLDTLMQNLRTFHLLEFSSRIKINDFDTLQNLLSAKPIVSKLFASLPKPVVKTEPITEEGPKPGTIKDYRTIWAQLIDTNRAIQEVKDVRFDTTLIPETKNITTPNKLTGIEEKNLLTTVKSNVIINKKSFENLHPGTKSILNTLNLTEHNFQIGDTIEKLKNKLDNINLSISNINDPEFLRQMPNEAKLISGMSSVIGRFNKEVGPPAPVKLPTNIRASIKPLGIGDLKVVKQKLKKYVAGEVAHIENVLRGEYKERKNRVLDRTEDIFIISNETDEETTKDTQTTERFELKKESEKTVQEQMSIQAGVTVSGSYGMVTFGAHGDFAYNTSSQESNKNSSNFAREVIDKSVSRIQKKTKEERTTKKLHEVEEINTHGIDNKDKPDHAIGIYRWVDKYYDAQIYNYGKRMMFEFIIPEPSSFFEYAQTHKPKKDLVSPIIPYRWFQDEKGNWIHNEIITHKDINQSNYQSYIRDYNVQGVTTPPLPLKTISTAIAKEGMPADGNSHVVNNTALVVPAGYISKVGVWFDVSAIYKNSPKLEITVGNKIFRPLELHRTSEEAEIMPTNNNNDSVKYAWFWPETPIQISVNSYDVISYTLNAFITVELTAEAYEQWQINTYEKIMTAYKAMQVEYEQKASALEVQEGIIIHGQNPRINREIETTELKKQCMKELMDTSIFGSFHAMKDPGNGDWADFELSIAFEEGKTIQFFEQAFEWENLTYLFYPYFWGRKSEWVHKINTYDTDPLFTKFLQAGSARVVLPVHPGYNDVIAYYMQTGKVWGQDGNPPLIHNPDGSINNLFISIADELRNQTDDLAKATPEDEPWEVILPTTLVYLQQDSDLPTFEDQ